MSLGNLTCLLVVGLRQNPNGIDVVLRPIKGFASKEKQIIIVI